MTEPILQVENLKTYYYSKKTTVAAVDGVNFSLKKGSVLGIVGESGCGKSTVARSLVGLLDHANSRTVAGSVIFDGRDVLQMDKEELRQIRGKRISMIFQDPFVSLNPVYTIKDQIYEVLKVHENLPKAEAAERVLELLRLVGIPHPELRLNSYPYQLSGGMQQRVMIAIALACQPDILLADEPTTALDVTVQAQILELLKDLQRRMGMAILMITHDLGVVAGLCNRVVVMYAGTVCEQGPVEAVFHRPGHQYTKGLLRSVPSAGQTRLVPIPGTPVDLLRLPPGCPFAPRCDRTMHICVQERCPRTRLGRDHTACCWMNQKRAAEKEEGRREHHTPGGATPPEAIL